MYSKQGLTSGLQQNDNGVNALHESVINAEIAVFLKRDVMRRDLYIKEPWVIPCQINQFFAKFARPPSDVDEIWHTCR